MQHTMKHATLMTPAKAQTRTFTPALATQRSVRSVLVKATSPQETSISVTRRQLMLGSGIVVGSGLALPTLTAHAEEFALFRGFATPPTSYGGYGGNADEAPKYTFEYPESWKSETPSKSEKGTKGVDGRVVNPRVKGQRAFVITLGRAGEDNKSFRLTDLDTTFQGFAGADYDLQDALVSASEIGKSEKEVDGNAFYQFDIDSPETRYLASITVSYGKVYALFVKSPARSFKASEDKLRHIIDSFKLV